MDENATEAMARLRAEVAKPAPAASATPAASVPPSVTSIDPDQRRKALQAAVATRMNRMAARSTEAEEPKK